MKLCSAVRASILLLAVLALMAGCSALVTTTQVAVPAPGPQVKAGLKAVMPLVSDKRAWPTAATGEPDPNVHIFAPAITSHLRSGLTASGLFAALPAPDAPGAAAVGDRMEITVNQFSLNKLGNNPWAAPAYIVDGLVQPVSGVVLIATKGQVDTGAYLLPSTHMGTTINADLAFSVKGINEPVLRRSYLVLVELGSVSGRQLRAHLEDKQGYGVKVGKAEGLKALNGLVQSISRDPHWLFLNSYVRLAQARQVITAKGSTPEQRMRAAQTLIGTLQPLAYSPDEAKALRDGALDAAGRAEMANSQRVRYLGLADEGALPAAQRVSAAQATKLFNSPAVERAQVQGEVGLATLNLIMKAMTPRPGPKPAPTMGAARQVAPNSAGGSRDPAPGASQAAAQASPRPAKPSPPEVFSPQAQGMRDRLAAELAAALKGKLRLQAAFLVVADDSVGPAWPTAKKVLSQIGSRQTKAYLAQREAS